MPNQRARFHFDNTFGPDRQVGPYILWQTGDLYCEPDYTVNPHQQSVFELTYVVAGHGYNLAGGTSYSMEPGMLFFNAKDDLHAITVPPNETLRYFYLGFDFAENPDTDIAELQNFFRTLAINCVPHAESIGDAFIRLFEEVHAEDFVGRMLCESTLQEILCTAVRLFSRSRLKPYRTPDMRAVDAKLVSDIIHFLDAHSTEIHALSDLEQEYGYSYTYLSQKFSEIMGESLRSYLTRSRFLRAQEYLRRGETVTKTAELCGYQSIHAFSRAFHRVVGLTPIEYRRKYNVSIS